MHPIRGVFFQTDAPDDHRIFNTLFLIEERGGKSRFSPLKNCVKN